MAQGEGITIVIRPALRADLADLIALDSVALTEPGRRADIAAWIDAGQCHVAMLANRIAGYLVLTEHFFHQPFVEMLMVGLDDRRHGIGRALLDHCQGLIAPDCKLFSSTNRSNLPMQRLFDAAGFIPSGIVENLDDGDPELIYVRLPETAGQG